MVPAGTKAGHMDTINLEIVDTMAGERNAQLFPVSDRPSAETMELQHGFGVWRDASNSLHYHLRITAAQAVILISQFEAGKVTGTDPASLSYLIRPVTR